MNDVDQDLFKIAKEISQCRECFRNKDFPFIADPPDFEKKELCKKIMIIGINPAMQYCYEDYKVDYENIRGLLENDDYDKKLSDSLKKYKKPPQENKDDNNYSRKLANLINVILMFLDNSDNKKIPFLDKDNFYDYVYWSNASFCPSPNTSNYNKLIRIKSDNKSGDVYKEIYKINISKRITNCKDNISKLINVLQPKLIIVAGTTYYKSIKEKIKESWGDETSHCELEKLGKLRIISDIFKKGDDKKYVFTVTHPASAHVKGAYDNLYSENGVNEGNDIYKAFKNWKK